MSDFPKCDYYGNCAEIEELGNEIARLTVERINLLNWLNTHHPHVAIAWAQREPKP